MEGSASTVLLHESHLRYVLVMMLTLAPLRVGPLDERDLVGCKCIHYGSIIDADFIETRRRFVCVDDTPIHSTKLSAICCHNPQHLPIINPIGQQDPCQLSRFQLLTSLSRPHRRSVNGVILSISIVYQNSIHLDPSTCIMSVSVNGFCSSV